MEGDRPPFQVVVPAPPTEHRRQLPSIPGVLSVEAAWKFTPLTNSPQQPHNHLIIPSLAPFNRNAHVATKPERNAAAEVEVTPAVRKGLQNLLKPEELAEIKFKKKLGDSRPQAPEIDLSLLARQVLEMTQIDYRFRSNTPTQQLMRNSTGPSNGVTPSQNFGIILPARQPQVVVKIPQPSNGFRRDEYATLPDTSKRRKLSNEARDVEIAMRLRTQREDGDTAVLQLQDLMLEIFEVHDRLELDISNGMVPGEGAFFELPDEDEDYTLRLAVPTLDRLVTSMKQLVDLHRLGDIIPEHLKRLQDLCGPSIEAAQLLNLRLGRDPSDEDISIWRRRVRKAANGAAASCVFLYTGLGNRDDNSVLSPDMLHSIPNLLVNVYETCLIPVIESRQDGQDADLYRHATSNQNELKSLLELCRKLLDLLATACIQVSEAVDCVNPTEFLAAKLIFVQNSATEKTSALGSQTYERVRKQAMFSLARLYAIFPEQRSPILDEILSSLDRLPSTSRSARQYKLRNGKSIMLISALFMQLVQTSAHGNSQKQSRSKKKVRTTAVEAESEVEDDMDVGEDGHGRDVEEDDLSRLRNKADQLFTPASKSCQEIVYYMIGKASKVSKTGDSPYRNVLDLFVEDLVNLLSQPEWPAAELLLRILAARMTELANTEKAAGIKNMALESLGTMGSAISDTRASALSMASNLSRDVDGHAKDVSATLVRLTDQHFAVGLSPEDLFGPEGPFAIISQYLEVQVGTSLRAKSAESFFLAQYAKLYSMTRQQTENESQGIRDLTVDFLEQLSDPTWASNTTRNGAVDDPRQASLAYLLSILNLGFCRRYESIVKTLSSSLSSEQAQVRSRSLKSVVTILETDPGLLDRIPTIADDVFRCASDDSAMVRDAALSVIAKFMVSKPALEEKAVKKLLACANDSKMGVQKRSINLLAEIYTRESRPMLRAAIAQTYLRRTVDLEDSVGDLAKRALKDAWISPNIGLMSERSDQAKSKIVVANLTSHIVDCIRNEPTYMASLLTKYLTWLLNNDKTLGRSGELLDKVVEDLFQSTIDGSATESSLITLMSIAEARPQSVAPQQLSSLKQYLKFISTEEDLPMFRSVIGIFRHVLPRLSISHQALLKDIQGDLMNSINKLARRIELDEVMSCLRTIDGVLGNSIRFVKLLASIVGQIRNPSLNDNIRTRLIRIAGSLGKHIDLDQLPVNGQIPSFKGGSVAGFLTDVIYPYAARSEAKSLQLVALESLGAICQAWPAQFTKTKIRDLFHSALAGGDMGDGVIGGSDAQLISLRIFEDLYSSMAVIKEEQDKGDEKPLEVQDLKKMGGSKKAQDDTSALSLMATYIYDQIVKIALVEEGEKALLAVRLLSSVATRGMFHPKDYAHVFLALETSSDVEIRSAAEKAHQLSHQHHESHWEREYVNAVRQAFAYQQKHSEDSSGSWQGRAKLASCFNVVNSSGPKYVKKFVSTLISRLSTDFTKLNVSSEIPNHVYFVRFVVQNIGLFDYSRQDDLLHAILQLELLFSKNGAEISQAIETNLATAIADPLPLAIDADGGVVDAVVSSGLEPVVNGESDHAAPVPVPDPSIDPVLLKQLATAACAVTMVAEAKAHLKRQYGISRDVRAAMQQNKQAKDSNKAPIKVHGITGERLLTSTTSVLSSLTSVDGMVMQCREFHTLMTIDEEVRVGAEEDAFRESHSADPVVVQQAKGARKRRREGGSIGGTPKRPRGRPRKSVNGTRRSSSTSSREDPEADYFE